MWENGSEEDHYLAFYCPFAFCCGGENGSGEHFSNVPQLCCSNVPQLCCGHLSFRIIPRRSVLRDQHFTNALLPIFGPVRCAECATSHDAPAARACTTRTHGRLGAPPLSRGAPTRAARLFSGWGLEHYPQRARRAPFNKGLGGPSGDAGRRAIPCAVASARGAHTSFIIYIALFTRTHTARTAYSQNAAHTQGDPPGK